MPRSGDQSLSRHPGDPGDRRDVVGTVVAQRAPNDVDVRIHDATGLDERLVRVLEDIAILEPVDAFFEILRKTGNVTDAARRSGFDRRAVYQRYKDDPAFKERWNDAIEEAGQALLGEARRRATEGVEEPVYQKGELVGYVTKYSDVLLIFLIKGIYPQYKDRLQEPRVDPRVVKQWTTQQLEAYASGVPLPQVLAMAPKQVESKS